MHRDCTIFVAKTKTPISCVFVFASAKSFSHDMDHIKFKLFSTMFCVVCIYI